MPRLLIFFRGQGLYKILILAPLSKNFRIPNLIKLGAGGYVNKLNRLSTFSYPGALDVKGSGRPRGLLRPIN